MRVAHFSSIAIAALLFAAPALAAEIAPGDVKFTDAMVTDSLTGQPGDAAAGAKTFKDKSLGNCLACHANKDMAKELFHGNVGPALDGVASRYEVAQLRAIVTNAKAVFGPDTAMPGFYSLEVGKNVDESHVGKTILGAQDVENVVAYLATLKE
jgi:sulfur-oxidizing protein SoxX